MDPKYAMVKAMRSFDTNARKCVMGPLRIAKLEDIQNERSKVVSKLFFFLKKSNLFSSTCHTWPSTIDFQT